MTRKRLAAFVLIVALAVAVAWVMSNRSALARAGGPTVWSPLAISAQPRDPGGRPFTPSSAQVFPTQIITGTTPQALAEALGIPASALVAASLNGSDVRGVGIGTTPIGNHFPTEGDTFVILSTGLAESAEWPNAEDDLSFELDGLFNSEGNDLVQLALQLRVPPNRNCANLDFAFYSEEYPEWVGSEFNDTFTAELGGTNLIISGTKVIAPLNFAFDTAGNIMSVNTVFGFGADTGTTYDGGTSLLRAQTPVVPDSTVEIVFSVQDLGDSILDSAAFLDKFFWSEDASCGGGAREDSDGDGLLDVWEAQGVTVTVDGVDVFVDLPGMGADPLRKDIFVEIDYMVAEPGCFPFVHYCFSGHSHVPKPRAMEKAIYSFFLAPVPNPDGSTGINLHVDYGPHGIMNPVTLETWGSRSQSNPLPHDEELGSKNLLGQYTWSEFKAIKRNNFSEVRAPFFHYAVFAHNLGGLGSTSGMSRGIGASDFIVSFGSWNSVVGTVNEQAGTLMHELGHNLGLRHSGRVDLLDTNFKPNFLSVMNYAFQTRGLRVGGKDGFFDYSRFELPTLDEDNLDETVGLNAGTTLSAYGTRYWCAMNDEEVVDSADVIDWNCDGDSTDTGIQENINEGPDWRHDTRSGKLRSYNDWANLVFTGGAIGQPGADPELPLETEGDEITYEQDATLTTHYGVAVTSSGDAQLMPGGTAVYTFTVSNLGVNGDTYAVTASSTLGWAGLGGVPASVTLPAGASADIAIVFDVPSAATVGSADRVVLAVVSQANPLVEDSSSVEVFLPSRVFLPMVLRGL
jgi:hypothetical protein